MQRRAIQRDENGKLLTCPRCDNEELARGDYCMICGANLREAVEEYGEESGNDGVPIDQGE